MNLKAFFEQEFEDHRLLLGHTRQQCEAALFSLVSVCVQAIENKKKIMFFGNGGSGALAQFVASKLTMHFREDREPVAAVALSSDGVGITSIANHFGYQEVFARQIRAIGSPGDVAVGFTASGKTKNIVLALQAAESMGVTPAAFTGNMGGDLTKIANPIIVVPSKDTPRTQEMHVLLGQIFCGMLEAELGLLDK